MRSFAVFSALVALLCCCALLCERVNAQCAGLPISPDACRFPSSPSYRVSQDNIGPCEAATIDPFATATIVQDSIAMCTDVVRRDGDNCIELWARIGCNDACARCDIVGFDATKVCKSLCDDFINDCPLSVAAGCLDEDRVCADNDDEDTCTKWDVDTDTLPSALGSPPGSPPGSSSASVGAVLAAASALVAAVVFALA